jgi:hypothetical protein
MVEAGSAPSAQVTAQPGQPGHPTLRWSSRARTLEGIQEELAKIWARPPGATPAGDDRESHVAARTSVLNLVVIVRRPEVGMRVASTISELTGRHPSRTLIVSGADPDGPSWLDAQIQAFCVVPREDAAETCAEMIYLTAGGEAGRHLRSLVAPLLVHDLPVTVWVPGEPLFGTPLALDILDMSDRLVVDGSRWNGNGLSKLAELAIVATGRIAVSDFALMRQSRWREAIAATFDVPQFTPFLRSIRRIAVTYATHDATGDPETTNLVKPVYHVAWIGGRLGMRVIEPVRAIRVKPLSGGDAAARRRLSTGYGGPRPVSPPVPGGFDASLRHGTTDVAVVLRPRLSGMPEGTTLRVEILAERRGSELRADVTAEADAVLCRVWQDGVDVLERRFNSPRMVDVELLAEAIERTGDDRIERETVVMAGHLLRPPAREGAEE